MPADTTYYLSCYLSRPDSGEVFRVRHDQAVALWARGRDAVTLVRYWELERVSGQKHHFWPLFTSGRAVGLIADLLAEEGLAWADISGLWGTPGLPAYRELPVPPAAKEFPTHSLAHLFSGLLMDSRVFHEETIVALAVDAGPDSVLDRETKPYWYAGCVARQGNLTFRPVESPGPLYTAAKGLFDREDGTLMALAHACDAVVEFDLEPALSALRLYGGDDHPSRTAVPFVRGLAEEARRQLHGDRLDRRFSTEDNVRSAVMKHVQRACELIAGRNVERLCEDAGVSPQACYLSMSGGFALNCPTNSWLLDTYGFKGLLTPPCPNDGGQALGLGLFGLHAEGLLRDRPFALRTAYAGGAALRLKEAAEEFAPWIEGITDFDPATFVEDVVAGPLAWVDGAAEVGPRALGHRSLLADPRYAASKDALNRAKKRQWWRPVAPIVLAEHAADWFELSRPSPFMLETARVRPARLPEVPAVAHLDGTARVQTLTAEADARLHAALAAFHAATGVPLLCNTSLNDKGEPIVNDAAQALNFCVRNGVRVAYVEGQRVRLRPAAGEVALPAGPRERRGDYFAGQEAQRDEIWERWRAPGYSDLALYLLTRDPVAGATPDDPDAAPTARSVRGANLLAELVNRSHERFAVSAARFRGHLGPGSSFDPCAYWEADQ